MLGLAAAIVATIVMSLNALQLSPQQQTESLGGTADFAANLPPVFLTPDYPVDTDLFARMGRVETELTVPLRNDGVPVLNEHGRPVAIRESEWDPNPYPDAIELTGGRFPQAPGELAASEALSTELGIGTKVSPALSDSNDGWVVVGTYVNNYRQDTREILAGAGTMRTLPDRYFSPSRDAAFTSTLFWNGDDPRPVLDQIQAQQEVLDGYLGKFNSAPSPLYYDRDNVLAKDRYSAHDRSLEYTIPAVVLPVVFSVFALVLLLVWLRQSEAVFEKAGVRRRAVLGGFLLACAAGITIFVVGGVVVGAIVGYLIRPALSSWVHRLLSPVVWPFGEIPRLLLLAAVGVVVGALAFYPKIAAGTRTGRARRSIVRTVLPYLGVIAVLAGCVAAVWVLVSGYQAETHGPEQYERSGLAIIFLTACAGSLLLLLSPLLVKRLGMSGLFVGRILAQERMRTSFIVLLLTVAVATPLMLSTTAPLVKQLSNATQLAEIPPGYVEINGGMDSGKPIRSEDRSDFEASTSLRDPIDVYGIGYSNPDAPDDSVFVTIGAQPKIGSLRAFHNEGDVETWLGATLTDPQRALLRGGGVLGDFVTGRDTVIGTTTMTAPPTFEVLPALPVAIPREFAFGSNIHGLVLLPTALEHNWPISTPRGLYSDLTDEQTTKAADYREQNGRFIDLSIIINKTQDVIPVPTSLQLAVWLMGILVVVLSLSVSRAVITRLRPVVRALHAAGIREKWLRNTAGLYLLPILLTSLVFGEFAGYLSVWVITTFNQDAVTEAVTNVPIPWSMYYIVAASFLVGAAVAYLMVARGLKLGKVRKQSEQPQPVTTPEGAEIVKV
ncbi:hypothetical protein AB4Z09_27010 [Rhodococcus sp. TAF43]|uniref:hypothetical protein n=1 Tax=Rhodococcus sp. TAF43 TaxID=3237483 RepID=UPI003F9A103A